MGGLVANMIKTPMKVKTVNGQAMKDEDGEIIMVVDKPAAKKVFWTSMLLGFSGSVLIDSYWHLAFSWLEIFALSIPVGALAVFIMTWAINTLHMRANTDLIATAIDLKNQIK